MAPACVAACPEGAIAIEIVDIAEWRNDYLTANAPGLPSADDSVSTTRLTLPKDLPPDTGRVDTQRLVPEAPHWPLVFMLVLTQLSAGAFAILVALDILGAAVKSQALLGALALAAISLGTASLHLGRPIYAWRAIRGLRRSWLSREVLTLSIFAGVAAAYVASNLLHAPARPALGMLTGLCGLAGIYCSARIYMVPARPAWCSRYTLAEFFSTALLLGPLFISALDRSAASGWEQIWLTRAIVAGGSAQLLAQVLKFLWLTRSDEFELRGSALLLSGRLQKAFLARLSLLIIAGIVVPLSAHLTWASSSTLALGLVSEWMGRWLFFVSVVPKNMAAAFIRSGRAAA
jgi:DMSO reductase anchor subunit